MDLSMLRTSVYSGYRGQNCKVNMAKRTPEDADIVDVSETTVSPKTNVGGIITSLSPMKKSRYFHGSISDGRSSLRLYGFDSAVRKRLMDHMEANESIVLQNCEVKPSRQNSDQLEIYVSPKAGLQKCLKEYDLTDDQLLGEQTTKTVSLAEVEDLDPYQSISVTVKSHKWTKHHKSKEAK